MLHILLCEVEDSAPGEAMALEVEPVRKVFDTVSVDRYMPGPSISHTNIARTAVVQNTPLRHTY